jgi:hypothetical protein
MVDLKVGRYYLICSRYAKERGKERIVVKYLGENREWESQSIRIFGHTCNGKGRKGYCMFDSNAEVIKEVSEDEVFLWQI